MNVRVNKITNLDGHGITHFGSNIAQSKCAFILLQKKNSGSKY